MPETDFYVTNYLKYFDVMNEMKYKVGTTIILSNNHHRKILTCYKFACVKKTFCK